MGCRARTVNHPVRRPELFADSSFHYALSDFTERHHEPCISLLRQLVASGGRLLTTNLIVAETHALLLSRLGRKSALDWLRGIGQAVSVVRVTEADEKAALEILTRYDDKNFSFVDATSFSITERLGITTALSLDTHFVQYGRFLVLPLEGERLPGP